MPKIREIIQPPPEPEGGAEEQIAAIRDYLVKITQELYYLLTHLESDNINDVTFERINAMIPRAYIGLPQMDGPAYAGGSANWARGDHRHPHDSTKVDKTRRINGRPLAYDVWLTKHDVGLGNVDNVKQAPITREINGYSLENDVTLGYSDVGAVPTSREINGHSLETDIDLDCSDIGAVTAETKVNGYPLTDDVFLDYDDVGAAPVGRVINGYSLADDIELEASDVGAVPATDKGVAGGVAELDANGMVPSAQLPSYVDDVLEYASLSAFPATGETGKIYVALDTNRTYRWSGSAYVEISASLALGESSSTAYRGDRGKTAYDHSQVTSGNPHNVTAAEVGARPDTWTPSAADVGAQPTITVSGILKGDGLGGVSEATAGTDYATPGMIPSVPDPSDATPQALGTAAAGSSDDYSRADHVHAKPTYTAGDVGLGNVDNVRQYSANNPPPVPDAEDVPYDNTVSGLMATDVQNAIDEIAQGGGGGGTAASAVSYDNTGSGLSATNVQDAIDEVLGDIPAAPSDIGALPADGTAVNARTLAVAHTVSGGVGWYKFFEDAVSTGASRSYDFLITNTYNWQSGILRVYVNRTSGVTTIKTHFLSGTIPADTVRWEYSDKLILYIYKTSDSNGYLQFRVFCNAARTGNPLDLSTRWKNEAVSEPTGAAYATADVLQFTAQAISAGTNQQILSISNTSVTEDHVLARIEFTDPAYITAAGSWSTTAGSFTLTGTATAATTANVLLIRKGN